jgi:hypothetical protein
VQLDEQGDPQAVRYHFVNAMVLNEVQQQHRQLAAVKAESSRQIESLRAESSRQIEALEAERTAQAARIETLERQVERLLRLLGAQPPDSPR